MFLINSLIKGENTMKINKLHTRTYIQLLQKVYILFIAIVLFGCCLENEEKEYIFDHTEQKNTATDGEYIIDIYYEDVYLIDTDLEQNLLTALKYTHENTIPDDLRMKNVMLFVPKDDKSYSNICDSNTSHACIQMFPMVDGDLIISIRPSRWVEIEAIKSFIHELIHYVAYKLGDNGDGSHIKQEYWGKNGLVNVLYKEILTMTQ